MMPASPTLLELVTQANCAAWRLPSGAWLVVQLRYRVRA